VTTRRKPPADGHRSLKPAEWDRLVRAKAYIPPPAPPLPLHVMAKARTVSAATDSPVGDSTNQKENTQP
jgi:hypothetical protein